MSFIKINIQGSYVDSQLYSGRLFLWKFDGSFVIVNWNKLIDSLIVDDSDRIAFTLSFVDGSYLYKRTSAELLKDDEFKNIFRNRFERISRRPITISEDFLERFMIGKQNVPFDELPIDSEVYSNTVFLATDQGLFQTAISDLIDSNVIKRTTGKLWDARLLSITASNERIALSAGSDGLFEIDLHKIERERHMDLGTGVSIVSTRHSTFSNYSELSLYNSSVLGDSFMALFTLQRDGTSGKKSRILIEEVEEELIFNGNGHSQHLSWGVDDKVYRATEDGVEIIRFNNFANTQSGERFFEVLNNIKFAEWKGQILSGGAAHFGVIVECENALVVLRSDNEIDNLSGSVLRWRVFNRSRNYQNQLHIVKEDKLEIYSFPHDYFVSQFQKTSGISVY